MHLAWSHNIPKEWLTYHGGSDAVGLAGLEPLHEGLEHQLLEDRAIRLRAQGTCHDGQHLCHSCQQLLIVCVLQQEEEGSYKLQPADTTFYALFSVCWAPVYPRRLNYNSKLK